MQVPTFTDTSQQVQPNELPNARVSTSAPAEAFGGPGLERVNQAAMQSMGQANQVFQEQKDRADQLAHIQADTALSQKQAEIQTDISKMKGQNALDAPEWMETKWKDAVDSISNGLTGQNQKLAFARTSSQRYQDLNKSVQIHVNSEMENFADQTYQSANDQATNLMVQNAGDDHLIQQQMDLKKQLMQGWAKRKGISEDDDIYKNKFTTEMSAAHLGIIHARLESGMDDEAQEYYDNNKDGMSAHDVIQAENALDASKVIGESSDLFNGILQNRKDFAFSDGSINGEKVRAYVMENSDASDQKKLKIMGQVKSMINEYNRDRYHKIAADERSFVNEVIGARQAGVPLTQALRIATKWGYDKYDMAQKADFVRKTYETPTDTKIAVHENLREGIQAGVTELSDIDRAGEKGDITPEQRANLRQLKLKTLADGTDPTSKYYDNQIKDVAKKQFGSDKDKIDNFMFTLNKDMEGKRPEEKLARAKEMMKDVPGTGIWGYFGTKQYEKAEELRNQREDSTGQMENDIGYKQIQGISSGMTGNYYQREPNPGQHLEAFRNELGIGADDLKIGTPYNNAIVSLQRKGKTVTPYAVKRVLEIHPDGNWQ